MVALGLSPASGGVGGRLSELCWGCSPGRVWLFCWLPHGRAGFGGVTAARGGALCGDSKTLPQCRNCGAVPAVPVVVQGEARALWKDLHLHYSCLKFALEFGAVQVVWSRESRWSSFQELLLAFHSRGRARNSNASV